MKPDQFQSSTFDKHGILPTNLARLYAGEEQLRDRAISIVAGDVSAQLHLASIEAAMDLADVLRQYDTADEDLKVIQVLGMRTFNAFGASLKLALSGYSQNSVLILRDVLETVFLIDYFSSDRSLIERWRLSDKKTLIGQVPALVQHFFDISVAMVQRGYATTQDPRR